MEINEEDQAEIARLIQEGYQSGILDGENTRTTWRLYAEKYCTLCDGTGKVPADGRDSDGNIERGVNEEKCECQVEH